MKIRSINQSGTNNVHDVCFDLDGPIDHDAMLGVKVDGFSVKVDGQCLRVQANGELAVSDDTVRALNRALELAVAFKEQKNEQLAKAREHMLTAVRENTALK